MIVLLLIAHSHSTIFVRNISDAGISKINYAARRSAPTTVPLG